MVGQSIEIGVFRMSWRQKHQIFEKFTNLKKLFIELLLWLVQQCNLIEATVDVRLHDTKCGNQRG